MTRQQQFIFWSAAFIVFIALVVMLSSVLLPFVLGMVIAYLLNPLVRRICIIGVSRRIAALLILTVFMLLLLFIGLLAGPPLYREIAELCNNIPVYINRLQGLMEPVTARIEAFLDPYKDTNVAEALKESAAPSLDVAGKVLLGVVAGGRAFIHIVSLLVITPIVAYFMMKEWNYITSRIEGLIPLDKKETIMGLLKEIDRKLSGFIRGQLSVMFVLATGYSLALTFAGLQYGFLIGIVTGLLSVIPLVGSTFGLVVGAATAFFQSGGDWSYVGLIAGIFLVGQLIEGNLITPYLVGGSIGLHPLWVFFALLAGGSLFGFVGLLLAVPVAAVISVLLAFAIRQYKLSPLYMGKKDK